MGLPAQGDGLRVGLTCWRKLRHWHAAGVSARLDCLGNANAIDWSRACIDSASFAAKKGAKRPGRTRSTRSRPSSKRHLLVDGNGIPLSLLLKAANRHDSKLLKPLFGAGPPIRQCTGRARMRPDKLHAGKDYDVERCRRVPRQHQIVPRIAGRWIESCEKLGRHRWVIKRTLAWFSRLRRLTVRYKRRLDILQGLHLLTASLICLKFVTKWFC